MEESRRTATETLVSIVANSGTHCLTAEAHASWAFIETTNVTTFTDEDKEVQHPDHSRPLYVATQINNVHIRRALVDTLKVGLIFALTKFHVIDSPFSYHALLGKPWLQNYKLVPSTYYQCVKGRLNGKPICNPTNPSPFDLFKAHYFKANFNDDELILSGKDCWDPITLLGMAMGWVRVRFFYIQTRLVGLYPLSEPSPFNKQVFYSNPKPTSWAPVQPSTIRAQSKGPKPCPN